MGRSLMMTSKTLCPSSNTSPSFLKPRSALFPPLSPPLITRPGMLPTNYHEDQFHLLRLPFRKTASSQFDELLHFPLSCVALLTASCSFLYAALMLFLYIFLFVNHSERRSSFHYISPFLKFYSTFFVAGVSVFPSVRRYKGYYLFSSRGIPLCGFLPHSNLS